LPVCLNFAERCKYLSSEYLEQSLVHGEAMFADVVAIGKEVNLVGASH
jgi:hypothetical protein